MAYAVGLRLFGLRLYVWWAIGVDYGLLIVLVVVVLCCVVYLVA